MASEHQLPEEKEAHRSDNLDEYSEIQLLSRNGPHYTPLEFEEQQDPPELQKAPVRFPAICTFRKSKAYIYIYIYIQNLLSCPSKQAYGNHGSYDSPYENVRGQGLPSQQEVIYVAGVPALSCLQAFL